MLFKTKLQRCQNLLSWMFLSLQIFLLEATNETTCALPSVISVYRLKFVHKLQIKMKKSCLVIKESLRTSSWVSLTFCDSRILEVIPCLTWQVRACAGQGVTTSILERKTWLNIMIFWRLDNICMTEIWN